MVHDDILGGMNNWLEHRCPMSIYGCGFSQRRIFPSSRDTLIYSPAVESFGITRRDLTKKSPEVNKQLTTTSSRKSKGNIGGNQTTSVKNLIDLPIELLLEIFNYLESFRYAYYNIIIFFCQFYRMSQNTNFTKISWKAIASPKQSKTRLVFATVSDGSAAGRALGL